MHVPLIPILTVESGEPEPDPGLLAGTWSVVYLLDLQATGHGTPSFELIEKLSGVFHVIYDFCPRTVDDVVDALIKGVDEMVIDPRHMDPGEMDEVMDLAEGIVYKYVGLLPPQPVRAVLWMDVGEEHERFFKDIPVYVRRGIRASGTLLGIIVPAGEVLYDRGTQKSGQIRINHHRFV